MRATARRRACADLAGIMCAKIRTSTALVAALSIAFALVTGQAHSAEPAGGARDLAGQSAQATPNQGTPNQPTPNQGTPSQRTSIQAYGDHDKSCVAWTDACVSCRLDAGGALTCNNVGIACQPGAITCTARRSEPAK
jgi:hypothetical protein